MSGFWVGFVLGALLVLLLAQNVDAPKKTTEEKQGKRINELTDKELSSIYKEVNDERLRRLQAKENAPFKEFEEEDKHE